MSRRKLYMLLPQDDARSLLQSFIPKETRQPMITAAALLEGVLYMRSDVTNDPAIDKAKH
jgi:hypothetical protein